MSASHRRLNTKLHNVVRASSLLLAFFVVRSAEAGEQLSIAQLVKQADAVALVDNTLRSSVAIRRWLGGTEPRVPFSLESPLCIPDKDMLLRWQSSHKNHAGAPTWQRTLAVGHADQLVFFKLRQGVLVPLCETEVMLGLGFATHPDFKATLEEVEGRLRDQHASVATPGAAPVVDPAPGAAPVVDAAPVSAPAPVPTPAAAGAGCF
jgi:hypothetical protein